ncbi:MAG: hypothetical protein Q7T57_08700 [Dehalococcoidales bacterium]|nr:hypothetical protein [Dehalococcoidales bacterium]
MLTTIKILARRAAGAAVDMARASLAGAKTILLFGDAIRETGQRPHQEGGKRKYETACLRPTCWPPEPPVCWLGSWWGSCRIA